jgi:hypothetical protein
MSSDVIVWLMTLPFGLSAGTRYRHCIALHKAAREDFAAERRGRADVAAGLLHDGGED